MTKLQAQLNRLYAADLSAPTSNLVRSMVLQLRQPASWHEAAKIWQGVQQDLQLPAPAIAVSGTDAYQLWFSFAEGLSTTQAASFIQALQQRYAPTVAQELITWQPWNPTTPLPPFEVQAEQWSAFVAPDLAPVFADTPWLDIPPNAVGQAELLSRLDSIPSGDLNQAWQLLNPPSGGHAPTAPSEAQSAQGLAPKPFLLRVMNDESLAMALRIEAAKALLPYC